MNESEKKQKEKVSENGSSGANGCPKLTTKLKLLESLTIEEEENGRLAAKDICQKVIILIYLDYIDPFSSYHKLDSIELFQLLQKDPNQRLGVRNGYYSNAKEVQSHPFFATISMKHLKAGHYYPPFQPDVSSFGISALVGLMLILKLFSKKPFMQKMFWILNNFRR